MKITKKISRPKYIDLAKFFEEKFEKQEAKCLAVSDPIYLTTFRAKINLRKLIAIYKVDLSIFVTVVTT